MSYPPPPDASGYAQPQTNQKALWAMILGILSPLCCGLVTGIPAMILGNIGSREIRESGGTQAGDGMAKAGLILGIIGTALSVVSLVLLIFGVLSFPTNFETTTP